VGPKLSVAPLSLMTADWSDSPSRRRSSRLAEEDGRGRWDGCPASEL